MIEYNEENGPSEELIQLGMDAALDHTTQESENNVENSQDQDLESIEVLDRRIEGLKYKIELFKKAIEEVKLRLIEAESKGERQADLKKMIRDANTALKNTELDIIGLQILKLEEKVRKIEN